MTLIGKRSILLCLINVGHLQKDLRNKCETCRTDHGTKVDVIRHNYGARKIKVELNTLGHTVSRRKSRSSNAQSTTL